MMTTDQPTQFVPRLRLAEFRNEPPWKPTLLKKLAKRIKQRNTRGAELRVLTNSAEHGVLNQREYFDKDIATNTRNYFIVELGDYVYNPRKSAAAPVGPISKNRLGMGVMSPLYTVFRFQSDANDFFAHYFKSSHWHGYLRRVSNSGARHDRMAITNDDLMRMPIPTPSPREQQKIAECLSSLDDLIAVADQKLEVLRQHKQGLMQQLFPQPGETVPKLRFPEFRDAPEWKTHRLDGVTSAIFDGTHQTPKYTEEGVPFYSVENLISGVANKFISREDHFEATRRNKPEKGDILLTRIGKIGYSQAATWDHEFSVYVTLAVIKASSSFHTNYLALFFQSSCYQAELLRKSLPNAVPPKINMHDLRSTLVLLPDMAEQQKIADCLSSLDDLIATVGRKLEALRQHKQGLMQQLFPSPDGQ